MSMNFSEFQRLLNSDPASQDAQYQAARRSSPKFVKAAAASDAFELQLKRATRLKADAALVAHLKTLATSAPTRKNPLFRLRYALAATVVLAFSSFWLMQQFTPRWDSVEGYVADHYFHDGDKVLAMANEPNNEDLNDILANFGLQMDTAMSRQVRFVKYCPTPAGKGVHLVLETKQGLVTVILMPDQKVKEGERFAFNDMAASLVNLPGQDMSLAIIYRPELMNAQLTTDLGLSLQRAVINRTNGA